MREFSGIQRRRAYQAISIGCFLGLLFYYGPKFFGWELVRLVLMGVTVVYFLVRAFLEIKSRKK